jgi:uncharacterized protein YggE
MRFARIAAAAVLLLAVAAFAGVGLPDAAQGQEATPTSRVITTSGVGSVTTVPDRAHFSFGVQIQARTASQALENSDAQLRRVVADLRGAGVAPADIQTEQVYLSPRTSEDGGEILGYTAVSSVSVRVRDLGRAGAVVDAAVGAGANQVSGPALTRSDQEALYRNALRDAYADARAKAQALASAAGVTLGNVTAVVEGGGVMSVAEGRDAATTAIEPGTQELQATVTVTFAVS